MSTESSEINAAVIPTSLPNCRVGTRVDAADGVDDVPDALQDKWKQCCVASSELDNW